MASTKAQTALKKMWTADILVINSALRHLHAGRIEAAMTVLRIYRDSMKEQLDKMEANGE